MGLLKRLDEADVVLAGVRVCQFDIPESIAMEALAFVQSARPPVPDGALDPVAVEFEAVIVVHEYACSILSPASGFVVRGV